MGNRGADNEKSRGLAEAVPDAKAVVAHVVIATTNVEGDNLVAHMDGGKTGDGRKKGRNSEAAK